MFREITNVDTDLFWWHTHCSGETINRCDFGVKSEGPVQSSSCVYWYLYRHCNLFTNTICFVQLISLIESAFKLEIKVIVTFICVVSVRHWFPTVLLLPINSSRLVRYYLVTVIIEIKGPLISPCLNLQLFLSWVIDIPSNALHASRRRVTYRYDRKS